VTTLGVIVSNLDAIYVTNSVAWWVVATVSGIVATAITGGWWWFNKTSKRTPITTPLAFIESVVIGVAYGATQVIMASLLNVASERDAVLTFVSTVLGIAILGPAAAILVRGRHTEEQRRAELMEQVIAVSAARDDVVEIAQRMQLALDVDIDQTLSSARAGIEEQLADQELAMSQENWPTIALALRTAAQDSVRPLSRRLWLGTPLPAKRISFSRVLSNIVTQQPFQLPSLILIYVLTAFAGVVTNLGWAVGLVTLGAGVALIALVLGGANFLMKLKPHLHAVIFILAAMLLQVTSLLSFPVRARWGEVPYSWEEYSIGVVASVALIFMTSGIGSLRSYREDVARTFRLDVDHEFLASMAASRHIAQIARESARNLHGKVQTRLIACAVAIERATEQNDIDSFQHALREAAEVLKRPQLEADEVTNVAAEVARKVELWSGLCEISVEIDPITTTISGRRARDVGRVVEEGLNNAIKHGVATRIDVHVRAEPEGIVVEVSDNGKGPLGGEPGLGSALLDNACDQWSLTATETGACLRALSGK